MWGMFFAASLLAVVLLYLVGFLLLKAFRFPALFAIAGAPIISTLCYEVLAIGFDKAGVSASWASLFFPSLVVAGVVLAISAACRRFGKSALVAGGSPDSEKRFDPFAAKMLLLYVGLGLLVGLVVFVKPLDGPECFNQTYDNLTHLGLVRSFAESGHYSSLNATQYWDLGMTGSYYPAGWHMVTAMVCDALGVSNLLATNAMNYICCSLVYPVSCLCLTLTLFPEKKTVVAAGAFASIGFVTFPWFFTVYGVLESNLYGFIMVPVMLVAVINVFGADISCGNRIRHFLFACFSVLFCVFAQPNTFFTVLLFAIPYLAWRIWEETGPDGVKPMGLKARIAWEAAFFAAIFVFWAVCYKAPFLYAVTHFVWDPGASKAQGLVNVLLFSNTWSPAALVMAVLTIVGLGVAVREKRHGWLVAALGLGAVVYYVGLCFTGTFDHFVSGFWYSDWRRTAALQAMAALPIASLGIAWLHGRLSERLQTSNAAKAGLGLCLCLLLFYPSFTVLGMGAIQTPFGYLAYMLDELYGAEQADDEIIFSTPEQEFVKQVKDIVGDDVVYNIPYDGSFLAYQVDGLRTVYRLPYTGSGHNDDQRLIQARLYEYATNHEVQDAIDAVGAKYVLMLDYGHIPYHRDWPAYSAENWEGITAIGDNTPGFESVLSEGDMRLYRILEQ